MDGWWLATRWRSSRAFDELGPPDRRIALLGEPSLFHHHPPRTHVVEAPSRESGQLGTP